MRTELILDLKTMFFIFYILGFVGQAQTSIFIESFETSNYNASIVDWNTICYPLASFNDNAPGGGNWCLESPAGATQGCFYQYINRAIPNIQQGDIIEVSGWLRVDSNYSSTFAGIGFGIDNGNFLPTTSNISYSSSTNWIQLTAIDTFFLSAGDSAVVILDAGLTGGPQFAQTYFDLIETVKIGNVYSCDTILDNSISIIDSNLTANGQNSFYQWLDCDNDYAIIPNQSNQTYTAPTDGNYAVQISNAGCTDTSACVAITTYGCDSLPILSTIVNDPHITATPNTTSYQWLDCDNNYAELINETGQSFTATTNGNYAVVINQNTCVDTSECVYISSIGLGLKEKENSQLEIFPNPSSEMIAVQIPENYLEAKNINIYNMAGKLVYTEPVSGKNIIKLDIKVLSPAMYIVKLDDGWATKLIKEQ